MPRSHSSKSKSPPPVQRNHLPLGPIMSSSQIPSFTPSTNQNLSPSFFNTMKEGVALGVGSSLGNRFVNSILGSPTVEIKSTPSPAPSGSGSNLSSSSPVIYGSTGGNPCEIIQKSFDSCIQERKPIENCQNTLDLLNKCLKQ